MMFSAAMLASCGQNVQQDIEPAAFHNVEFAQAPTLDGGAKSLSINIWKGCGEDPQPVVLFVHGGAWVSGDNNLEAAGSEQIKAIKMYQALYDAGTEAQLLLNDRAPHGNLGPEAASANQTFVLRTLFPKEK